MIFQEKLDKCARELRVWGEKLGKNFKEQINKSRERMNYFRGKNDAFSVQCFQQSVQDYTKALVSKRIFGDNVQNSTGLEQRIVIQSIFMHMLLQGKRKIRLSG